MHRNKHRNFTEITGSLYVIFFLRLFAVYSRNKFVNIILLTQVVSADKYAVFSVHPYVGLSAQYVEML